MIPEARRQWLAARAARRQAFDVHVSARGATRWVYDGDSRTWAAAPPPDGQAEATAGSAGDWASRANEASLAAFTQVSSGQKIRCAICGRKGYPGGEWMHDCSLGHAFECECGRLFSSRSGLASHRRPCRCGQHHPEVPGQTNEQGAA